MRVSVVNERSYDFNFHICILIGIHINVSDNIYVNKLIGISLWYSLFTKFYGVSIVNENNYACKGAQGLIDIEKTCKQSSRSSPYKNRNIQCN